MNKRELREEHTMEVCESALNILSKTYEISGRPDTKERNKKAVDVCGYIGNRSFYLEHTLIESFPNQLRNSAQLNFLLKLSDRLHSKLPLSSYFNLQVKPNSLNGHIENEKILLILQAWVLKNATALEIGSPSTAPNHFIREIPTGLGFEVSLYRFKSISKKNEKLNIEIGIDNNTLEEERVERMIIALNEKCPKLNHSKKNEIDLTILVLESNDSALACSINIKKALNIALAKIDKKIIPDRIVLVESNLNMETNILYSEKQILI